MEDFYQCIRIMQISTEKLQSTRYFQSLHRTSLIRSMLLQSRKQFCDLLYSLVKISSPSNSLLPPVIISNEPSTNLCKKSSSSSSPKRKSSHVDTVKRLRITST